MFGHLILLKISKSDNINVDFFQNQINLCSNFMSGRKSYLLQMFWQSALSSVTLASSYLMVNCVAELFSLNLIYNLVLYNKSPYRWMYGVRLEGGGTKFYLIFPITISRFYGWGSGFKLAKFG